MSLLLKALKRLETPPIAAPASPSSDESNAAIEPISTGGELVPDDASQPLSESLSVEADPTLWDAELPTTDNEPLPAEPVESLPDVILWSEEITALSTDKALFPAEIDALREPAHLDPAPTGDAIPEVEIAAPTINSTTDDQTEDDSPATILFAAPSDERATVIQAVVVLSVIEPPSFGDSVEQTPEAVVANPPLTIYAGDDAPPAALEAPDASSTFQSLRGAVPATTDEEPIVEELTPPVVIEDCTIDFATQSAATVETLPEHALRIAPVDPGDESEDLQLDHAALGMRLSQLRMHGLCENIASQITEADHPVVLLVPVLPLLGMESLVADLAKQFAARLGEAPRVLDLGTQYAGASLNPILNLDEARSESPLVMLTAESARSLSLAAWLPTCDAVYLIVDLPTTPRRAVYDAIEQLARRESRLAGCILLDAA